MMARVGRGGFAVVLKIEGGQAAIGVGSGSGKLPDSALIPCSIVGLYNVLSGVEYLAVQTERQCLIRLEGSHVELTWKRGTVDTVFRLTALEYKNLIRHVGESTRNAA